MKSKHSAITYQDHIGASRTGLSSLNNVRDPKYDMSGCERSYQDPTEKKNSIFIHTYTHMKIIIKAHTKKKNPRDFFHDLSQKARS